MGSNKRTLAIIGASVLMLGFFLPAISFFGLLSFSYFDLLTKASVRFITGLVIFALGGFSLFLALKNNFKPLIGTGILALAILVFDFITFKKALAGSMGTGAAAGPSPDLGRFGEEMAGLVIQPAWGIYLTALAAILLIVTGAMKDNAPTGTDWNRNPPPPPMNYS
jgi:hypothetical protein